MTNIAGLQAFFASGKALPCRYLLQTPLFSFAQNRGKFAPNCLALQLLHLFRKAAHRGKHGAKKAKPFGSPTLAYFYSIFRIWQSHLWQMFAPKTSFFPSPKIGANSLQTALPCKLLHLFYKVAHRGKQGAKKGEPFNDSSCYVVFCSVNFYALLMKTTPNLIEFFQEVLPFDRMRCIKLSCILC